jgi:hypothetical protein
MDWAGIFPISGTLSSRAAAYQTLVLTGTQVMTNAPFSSRIGGFALDGWTPPYSDGYIVAGRVLPTYRHVQVSAPQGKSAYPGELVTYTVIFTNTGPVASAFYISGKGDSDHESALNVFSMTETPVLAPGQSASVVVTSTIALFPSRPHSSSISVMIGSVAGLHDASIRGGWNITTTILPISFTQALTYTLDGPVWAGRPFTVTVDLNNLGPTMNPFAHFNLALYGDFHLLNPSLMCSLNWWSNEDIYCHIGRLEPGERRLIPIVLQTTYPGPLKGYLEMVDYFDPTQMLRYPLNWAVNAILSYFPLIRR